MKTYEKILGWVYYAIQMLILPQMITFALEFAGLYADVLDVNIAYFTLNFAAVVLMFHDFLWKSLQKAFSAFPRCLATAGIGMGAYFALNYAVMLHILLIYPEYANLNNANINDMAQGNFVILAIGTVLLVPIAEEVVFRGLIFRGIFNKCRILAYIVSALAFSAVHVIGYVQNMEILHIVLSLIQYVPAGLVLGWTYERTDTIWTPILVHSSINLIGMFAMIPR